MLILNLAKVFNIEVSICENKLTLQTALNAEFFGFFSTLGLYEVRVAVPNMVT